MRFRRFVRGEVTGFIILLLFFCVNAQAQLELSRDSTYENFAINTHVIDPSIQYDQNPQIKEEIILSERQQNELQLKNQLQQAVDKQPKLASLILIDNSDPTGIIRPERDFNAFQNFESDDARVVTLDDTDEGEEEEEEDEEEGEETKETENSEEEMFAEYDGEPVYEDELDEQALSKKHKFYGYGYWIRYLSQFPKNMIGGLSSRPFFVSHFTQRKDHKEPEQLGDRTLSVFMGDNKYIFSTYDFTTSKSNIQQISKFDEIEGLWTFVYFSYSVKQKKAFGWIKYGNGQLKTLEFENIVHLPLESYAKFTFGGKYGKSEGFNGQFSKIIAGVGEKYFMGDKGSVSRLLRGRLPIPKDPWFGKKVETKEVEGIEPYYSNTGEDDDTDPIIVEDVEWATEYSISGWFRWIPLQSQEKYHTAFRLTTNDKEHNEDYKHFGDRTLAAFIDQKKDYVFATYTYFGQQGSGDTNVVAPINHNEEHTVWHYIYFGYSRTVRKAYLYVNFKIETYEREFQNINHILAHTFDLYIAKDDHYYSYSGEVSNLKFLVGPKAFTLNKNDLNNKIFSFQEGLNTLLPPVGSRVEWESNPNDVLPSTDSDEGVVDKEFEENDESKINGFSEYGYAFWSKWSRTGPTLLAKKQDLHSLARLTTNKNHEDKNIGDRVLAIWIGRGFYHFTAYTSEEPSVTKNVQYENNLDGEWNYIHFGYKRFSIDDGQANGWVFFSNTRELRAITIPSIQNPVRDYVHFVMKKEFNYPFFNGYFAQIKVGLGQGYFMENKEMLAKDILANQLPKTALSNQNRQTVVVNEKAVHVTFNEEQFPPQDFENHQGVEEYSVSGWAKWVAPAQAHPWHLVARLSMIPHENVQDVAKLGDRTLAIFKANGFYHFSTYNCPSQDQDCVNNVYKNVNYNEFLEYWTFLYFGYSRHLKSTKIYVKFLNDEQFANQDNIQHFTPEHWSLFLQKDPFYPGYNGQMNQWVVNFGTGSFIQKGFQEENKKQHFGLRSLEHPKPQAFKPDLDIEEDAVIPSNQEDGVLDVELNDSEETPINGIDEYGYGYWCRWMRTAPDFIIEKEDWYSMSRLTTNKNHQNFGIADRTLAIWLGVGFYHFTAYSRDNPNIQQNIDYNFNLDGEWNYIYFSYKRQNINTGEAKGWVYFSQTQQFFSTQINTVQFLIKNYIHLLMKAEFDYPYFNGYFTKILFQLGEGSFIGNQEQLNNQIQLSKLGDSAVIDQSGRNQIIVEELTKVTVEEKAFQPQDLEDYPGVEEYSISGWVRWVPPTKTQQWHIIARLSQEKSQNVGNFDKIGDRTLSIFKGQGIFHFSTYSCPSNENSCSTNIARDVPYGDFLEQWTFLYYGYSIERREAQIYVEFQIGEANITQGSVGHFVTNYWSLFLQNDPWHAPFSGIYAYWAVNFGDGAFAKNDYDTPVSGINFGYQAVEAKTVSKIQRKLENDNEIISSNNDPAVADFEIEDDDDENDINGYGVYGYGFWSKWMRTTPDFLANRAEWYSISRLTINKNNQNAGLGDRTLAVWLGKGFYLFTAYTLASQQFKEDPNLQKNINYENSLEGQWNYIHFSYKRLSTDYGVAKAWIFFSGANDIKTIEIPALQSMVKDYLHFYMKKEFNYPFFNGYFAKILFGLGDDHFIGQQSELLKLIQNHKIPQLGFANQKGRNHEVNDEEKEVEADNQEFEPMELEDYPQVQEYSMSGWLKWTAPKKVEPWYLVGRLSALKADKVENMNKAGDRTLAIWKGNGFYHFATYKCPTEYDCAPNIVQEISYGEFLEYWTFIYVGYSRQKSKAFAYLKLQNNPYSATFDDVKHLIPTDWTFFFQKDKWYPGYSGSLGKWALNFGHGAYDTTPEQSNFAGIDFAYGGHDEDPLHWDWESEDDEIVPSNAEDGVADVELQEKDNDFTTNGVAEYGFGFWSKWQRTAPVYLPIKAPWHNVARVTTNQNHKDTGLGDRCLALFIGKGFYHFTAYSHDQPNLTQNINYEDHLEGQWNFIYYSYKRSSLEEGGATGFVYFSATNNEKQVKIQALQAPVKDYIHFIMKKEFGYQYFNGYFSQIVFAVGEGVYVADPEKLRLIMEKSRLPDAAFDDISGRTLKLQKDSLLASKDKDEFEPFELEEYAGVQEYSVSGWLRWVPPPKTDPWHFVVRLANLPTEKLGNYDKPGDRTLAILKGTSYYYFTTYSCPGQENDCSTNNPVNVEYGEFVEQWTFLYYGYSRTQHKTKIFVQFQAGEVDLVQEGIGHFFPHYFSLNLQKDKWYPGFNGYFNQWNANFGKGAYAVQNYGSSSLDFGFNLDAKKSIPIWESEEEDILDSNSEEGVADVEFEDGEEDMEITGIGEYGFSFWSKWLRTSPEYVAFKAPFYNMARITTNKNHGDIGMGDRALALFLGQGFYHFTSYSKENPNVIGNVNYDTHLDGEWNFIYYSYKRLSPNSGQAKGFVYFSQSNELKSIVNNAVQNFVKDYIHFIMKKEFTYPYFNGYFAQIRFGLGDGFFLTENSQVVQRIESEKLPEDALSDNSARTELITDEQTTATYDQAAFEPFEFEDEYAEVSEYAISGWARWVAIPKTQTWHTIARLSMVANDNIKDMQKPGDRTLSIWKGAGFFHFATYSCPGTENDCALNLPFDLEYGDQLENWVYFYYGYSRTLKQTHAYVKYAIGERQNQQKLIGHLVPYTWTFLLQKDPFYSGFNGVIGPWTLSFGKGAFVVKDYGSQPINFQFNAFDNKGGSPDYASEAKEIIESDQEPKGIVDVEFEEDEDTQISGLGEYGYGYWCKSLRTHPTYIAQRLPWYSMSRMTPNRNHRDVGPGDRALAIWLGMGFYHFTAYTRGNNSLIQNIEYGLLLDGEWNYVHYSYKRQDSDTGKAVGFVYFSQDESVKRIELDAVQNLVKDYMHFVMRKEFSYPFFNGKFSQITAGLGEGYFVQDSDDLLKVVLQKKLPEAAFYSNELQTHVVLEDYSEATAEEALQEPIVLEEYPEVDEYSYSGWIKWVEPEKKLPWNLVARLSMEPLEKVQNLNSFADRTLAVWKGNNIYQFSTYSCSNQENACNNDVWLHFPYTDQLPYWTFIYYGYSQKELNTFSYIKFANGALEKVSNNIRHLTPTVWTFMLQKDKWYSGYNGMYGPFVLNFGEGAYQVKNYDQSPINFGFNAFTKEATPVTWETESDQVILSNQEDGVVDVEFEEDDDQILNGCGEYGYGFWSKWLRTAPSYIAVKAPWYNVARFTTNKKHNDAALGDRGLAIWIGQGYYHFTTYSTGVVNIVQNVNYENHLDGEWNYIYYSYKRFDLKSGLAKAWVYFSETQEVKTVEMKAVHTLVNNYAHFLMKKEFAYPFFNGYFSVITFGMGEGNFIDDGEDFLAIVTRLKLDESAFQDISGHTVDLNEEVTKVEITEDNFPPQEFEEYPEVEEYSVSGWVKWSNDPKAETWHLVVRLSMVSLEAVQDAEKPGDRTLAAWKGDGYYQFATFTCGTAENDCNPNLTQNIEYSDQLEQWTYIYYGYSRELRQTKIYMKFNIGDADRVQTNVGHFVPTHWSLHLQNDQWYAGYNGAFGPWVVNFGKGAYKTEEYHMGPLHYAFDDPSAKSVPNGYSTEDDENLIEAKPDSKIADHEFFDDAENPIIGLTEYGYGFWTKWMRTYPTVIAVKQPWYALSRLTCNKKHGDAGLGDRNLAIWVGAGYYQFAAYNADNPNVVQNIQYDNHLDGEWNYIQFAYSKSEGKAVGWVYFSQPKETKQVGIVADQSPIKDYMHFVMKKEFAYPFFNGYLYSIDVLLGPGMFISSEDNLLMFMNKNKLPETAFPDKKGRSHVVVEEKTEVKSDTAHFEAEELEDFPGVEEYSYSGWIRWTKPTVPMAWHLLARLSMEPKAKVENAVKISDRTLSMWKGDGFYHFTTYTCQNQDNAVNVNVWFNLNYDDQLSYWTYVYYGYSKQVKSVYARLQLAMKVVDKTQTDIVHFTPVVWTLMLQKDKWHAGFNGEIGSFVVNFGQGAYEKQNYKSKTLNFGFVNVHHDSTGQEWESDEDEQIVSNKEDGVADVEFIEDEDTILNGIGEYGYGYWSKWLRTSPNYIITKTPWYSMSRFTQNKNHKDSGMGDRGLAIWLGQGFYQFSTYTINNVNVIANVNYNDNLEGEWNYIYYSYKRLNIDQGQAIGFVYFSRTDQIQNIQIQAVHKLIDDYAHFVMKKEFSYPYFNGYFTQVYFKLGDGVFIQNVQQFTEYLKGVQLTDDYKIDNSGSTAELVKTITTVESNEESIEPEEFEEYPEVDEYSVSGWIKWSNPIKNQPWHLVVRLAMVDKEILGNADKPGDRTLVVFKGAGFYRFATYTCSEISENDCNPNLSEDVEYGDQLEQWTYIYYGYSRKIKQTQIYVKYQIGENNEIQKEIRHFVPTDWTILLQKDQWYAGYNGAFGNWVANFGQGAFEQTNYVSGPLKYAFLPDPSTLSESVDFETEEDEIIASNSETGVVDHEFIDGEDDVSISGLSEYGFEFWAKWLRTGPNFIITKAPWYNIARLTSNKKHQDVSNPGDRVLGLWLGSGFYHFSTYSQDNNNLISNIYYDDQLDGQWNYIHYSYKRINQESGAAKGWLYFSKTQQIQSVTINAIQSLVKEYMHFIMKKEFNYPFFNGYFINVRVGLGEDWAIDQQNQFADLMKTKLLPVKASHEEKGKTEVINQDPVTVTSDTEAFEPKEFDQHQEVNEYSFSGWVRWIQPQKPALWHLLARLSMEATDKVENQAKIGDRTLAIWKGDGFYQFSAYGCTDNENECNLNQVQNINYDDMLSYWTFIYFGYSRKLSTAFGYIKFIMGEQSVTFSKLHQFIPSQWTFMLQKDKWYEGFNGVYGPFVLNFGSGAYITSKFDQSVLNIGYSGLEFELTDIEKEFGEEDVLPSPVEGEIAEIEIQEDDENHISGQGQYGYGFWSKWNRAGPNGFIPVKAPWYSMARLTVNKNHKDSTSLGDRTLGIWLGQGYYHFAATNGAEINYVRNIDYDDHLDGEWNYISYGYKRSSMEVGTINAFIYFSENQQTKTVTYQAIQPLLKEYVHFLMKKEFNYPYFNGYFSKIHLTIGHGGFIPDQKAFENILLSVNLPDEAHSHNTRVTVHVNEEEKEVTFDKEDFEPLEIDDHPDITEYSISGWVKWVQPAQKHPWNLVARLSSMKLDEITDFSKPGDRTLGIWKGDGYYHFSTYTCTNSENACNPNTPENIPYGDFLEQWVYLYMAYSKKLKSAFGYAKLQMGDPTVNLPNTIHFAATHWTFQLQKDKFYPGFNGLIQEWVLNFGEGSYRTGRHGQGDTKELTFAYNAILDEKLSEFKPDDADDIKEVTYDGEEGAWELETLESSETKINGIAEYGYGFWQRFLWNGPVKMLDKPSWMALARFTTNEKYGDAGYADRTLAIWIGTGFYHFTTYSTGKNNIVSNVDYGVQLDGVWVYVYFGYERRDIEKGAAMGHLYFPDGNVLSTHFSGEIIHRPIGNYMLIAVGSSGKHVNNYPKFNGQITKLQMNFGNGGYMEASDLIDLIEDLGAPPDGFEVKAKEEIITEVTDMLRDDKDVEPKEWPEEYAGADEYSIGLWFRQKDAPVVPWQVLYTLTAQEPEIRGNIERAGDRLLGQYQYQDGRQFFSTYTQAPSDGFNYIGEEITVQPSSMGSWIYTYFGYSREKGEVSMYLLQRGNIDGTKTLKTIHRVPKYLALYVHKDGIHTPFNGRFAYFTLLIGDGAYTNSKFQEFDSFIDGATQFLNPKPIEWNEEKDIKSLDSKEDDVVFKEWEDNGEGQSIDGLAEYGYGFWFRYMSLYPEPLGKKPKWMQLARFSSNEEVQDLASAGDRTLAIFIGTGFYHFTTYNLNGNLTNIIQNVNYEDKLEGVWSFIYYGFSQDAKQAQGYIKFSTKPEVFAVANLGQNIRHRPLDSKCSFRIGKEFDYPGANGQMAKLKVVFGSGAFIPDQSKFKEYSDINALPIAQLPIRKVIEIQGEEGTSPEEPTPTEVDKDMFDTNQYAVSGWFKWQKSDKKSKCQQMFRLTENSEEELTDITNPGDRTLAAFQCDAFVFSTYNLGTIDAGVQPNLVAQVPVSKILGEWTYVYFGYSLYEKVAGLYVKQTDKKTPFKIVNARHFSPVKFALYVGADKFQPAWVGVFKKVSLTHGTGAYIDVLNSKAEDSLPNIFFAELQIEQKNELKEETQIIQHNFLQ